jgi:hypothetical protein
MLYKFRSDAAGDVIMTADVGDKVLRAMGREPAAKGILEAKDLPALASLLERAMQEDEQRRLRSSGEAQAEDDAQADPRAQDRAIGLRQRGWPLLEMIRRSQADGVPVVWGV